MFRPAVPCLFLFILSLVSPVFSPSNALPLFNLSFFLRLRLRPSGAMKGVERRIITTQDVDETCIEIETFKNEGVPKFNEDIDVFANILTC